MASVIGKSMWSFVSRLDTKYDNCWRQSVVIDLEEAKRMKELGIRVQPTNAMTNEEEAAMGPYKVNIRRYERKRGGKNRGMHNPQPELVDANDNPFDEIIGVGSTLEVFFNTYAWNNDHGSGTGADLERVKVLELVPYEAPEDPESTPSDSATPQEPQPEETLPEDKF